MSAIKFVYHKMIHDPRIRYGFLSEVRTTGLRTTDYRATRLRFTGLRTIGHCTTRLRTIGHPTIALRTTTFVQLALGFSDLYVVVVVCAGLEI